MGYPEFYNLDAISRFARMLCRCPEFVTLSRNAGSVAGEGIRRPPNVVDVETAKQSALFVSKH